MFSWHKPKFEIFYANELWNTQETLEFVQYLVDVLINKLNKNSVSHTQSTATQDKKGPQNIKTVQHWNILKNLKNVNGSNLLDCI